MSKWCSVTNGCTPDRYRKKESVETVESLLLVGDRSTGVSVQCLKCTFLQEGIDQAVVERYPVWIDAAEPASCENALPPKSGTVRSNGRQGKSYKFHVQF